MAEIPDMVTLYFCPVCGEQKPPAWTDREDTCWGRWRSNVPNREGKRSEHEPTKFSAIVYARKGTER